ncbi:PH domain-containing protein [Actinokineospora auranticolor]|uniref:Putative membrane protein n=1 Tax=Actinokineospora auranticolor TaxID=155976 RepID=A0A2S6GUV8_9PSEU|nr:PH domain-containing protein [Actinokineospora auranticolor]PPK68979.1 putative membrane protein [Actinokineospora auranticolor]
MTALPAAPEFVEAAPEWGRLNPRMIVVRPLNELIGLLPVLVGLIFLGNVETWRIVTSVGLVALIVTFGLLSWLTTKYRITDTHVELHKGVVFRQRRSIPRDRVRTVDLTAKLGHRLFGLAAVRVGTGQQERSPGEGTVVLDAVTAAEADRLRQAFLHRPTTQVAVEAEATEDEGVPIAGLDTRWYRYAPLTLSGFLTIGITFGFIANFANEWDFRFSEVGAIREGFGWISQTDWGTVVPVTAGAVAVLSVFASLANYLLQNHNFRLTRQADGTVRVRRGLLTTRSVSIEEKRLRGAALHEPLLLRAGGGARLTAITTGLNRAGGSSLLLPPAPRAEADRVCADVLAIDQPPTSTPLTTHPPRARARRIVRAVVPNLLLVVVLAVLDTAAGWPMWTWLAAIALLPLSVLLGLSRYASLGHALTDRYLVSRSGSLDRRTVALQRTGVLGWKLTRTVFQRRAGVFTLTAVTAAGSGGYHVIDIGDQQGLDLVDEAVPDLIGQFLR